MNIKFCYLYRDAGNYKNYGEVVFSNPDNLSIKEVETIIRSKLIEDQWFIAKEWHLPDLHFDKWDEELDHGWHEFEGIIYTEEETTNGSKKINDFLRIMREMLH